jgi:hypothetical protein
MATAPATKNLSLVNADARVKERLVHENRHRFYLSSGHISLTRLNRGAALCQASRSTT